MYVNMSRRFGYKTVNDACLSLKTYLVSRSKADSINCRNCRNLCLTLMTDRCMNREYGAVLTPAYVHYM